MLAPLLYLEITQPSDKAEVQMLRALPAELALATALDNAATWEPFGDGHVLNGHSVWEIVLAEHGLQRLVWPCTGHRVQLLHARQLVCGRCDSGGDPAHCLAGLDLASSPKAAALQGVNAVGKPQAAAASAQIGGHRCLLWLIVLHCARALLLLICIVALLELMCVLLLLLLLLLLPKAAHLLPGMGAWRCRGQRHGNASCRRCGVDMRLPS